MYAHMIYVYKIDLIGTLLFIFFIELATDLLHNFSIIIVDSFFLVSIWFVLIFLCSWFFVQMAWIFEDSSIVYKNLFFWVLFVWMMFVLHCWRLCRYAYKLIRDYYCFFFHFMIMIVFVHTMMRTLEILS